MKSMNLSIISFLMVIFVMLTNNPNVLGNIVWDINNDFSVDNGNPNKPWSYGWMDKAFTSFTLYVSGDYSGGVPSGSPIWYTVDTNPMFGSVWKNTGSPIYGTATGQLAMHPGTYGSGLPAVTRWTAPTGASGSYNIVGRFYPGHYDNTIQVAVRINNVQVWHAVDSGAFNMNINVNTGDTIDFVVYGGNNSGGTTPLDATIIRLPVYSEYTWYSYNGHHYAITLDYSTWAQAEEWAKAVGGHLVTINDEAENTWLATFIKDSYCRGHGAEPMYNGAWIGLNYIGGDMDLQDSWEWTSTEPTTYWNFDPRVTPEDWGGTHMYMTGINHVSGLAGIWSNNPLHDVSYNDMPRGIIEIPGPPEPPWSFVQMTDLHIRARGKANDKLLDAVHYLNTMSQKPDFALVTGDIVDCAWLQVNDLRIPSGAFSRYIQIMNQLDNEIGRCEISENHDRYVYGFDNWDYIGDDFWIAFKSLDLSQYCAYLPGWINGGHYFNFEHKGLMFIGTDSGQDTEEGNLITDQGKYFCGTGLTDTQMNWLSGLEPSCPKIIFMHHPVINDPMDEWTISNYQDYLKNNYCKNNNVSLVLAGHTHGSIVFDQNQDIVSEYSSNYPLYIQTPAMKDGYLRKYNVSGTIVKPEEPTLVSYNSKITTSLYSPANIHVFDSLGNHVGITASGEVDRDIPDSYYLSGIHEEIENQSITLFPEKIVIYEPDDNYIYEVVGYEEGTYRLELELSNNGNKILFEAIDIPTSPGEVHDFWIDWDAIASGEEGVCVGIDYDSDGFVDRTLYADHNLTADEFALQTETIVDFDPDTLNLRSNGQDVTVYIELPEGFDVSDIDVSSIRLNDSVAALSKPVSIGDSDDNGILDLMVKFNRQQVINILGTGQQTIEVSGRLNDGTLFFGTDVIRVIR
jgi:predicted MPP superfamily phosphohydrolase